MPRRLPLLAVSLGLTLLLASCSLPYQTNPGTGPLPNPNPTTTVHANTVIVYVDGKKYKVGEQIYEWSTGTMGNAKTYKIHTQNNLYALRRDGKEIYNQKIFDGSSVNRLLGDWGYSHKNPHFKNEAALIKALKKAN